MGVVIKEIAGGFVVEEFNYGYRFRPGVVDGGNRSAVGDSWGVCTAGGGGAGDGGRGGVAAFIYIEVRVFAEEDGFAPAREDGEALVDGDDFAGATAEDCGGAGEREVVFVFE